MAEADSEPESESRCGSIRQLCGKDQRRLLGRFAARGDEAKGTVTALGDAGPWGAATIKEAARLAPLRWRRSLAGPHPPFGVATISEAARLAPLR